MARQNVEIRHPGYESGNRLLDFPAYDGMAHNQAYYPTIIAACRIITQNLDDVWLQKPDSDERFQPDTEELMLAGVYYLHTSAANNPCPIVPNWDHWEFPHDNLPQNWLDAADHSEHQPAFVSSENCCIGNKMLALESAHIIPKNEKTWFRRNEMSIYGHSSSHSGDAVLESTVNMLRLQAHAHKLWDGLHFCIVPRKREINREGQQVVQWTTQMMNGHPELKSDWHNKTLLPLPGRSVEYLYARFAWHIFPRLLGFLSRRSRVLNIAVAQGPNITRNFNALECLQFTVGQGRSRSNSPTKRNHSQMEDGIGDDEPTSNDRANGPSDDDPTGNDRANGPSDPAVADASPVHPKIREPRWKRADSAAGRKPLWEYDKYEEGSRGRKRTRI